jgi:RNA polymerase sigma factor (sigma-70 family)
MEASRAGSGLRLLGRPADRAFEQLYSTHAREVYQYTLALLANPADAEDATQTTFLNAYRAFQRGERPQKPHNWLIAIAHNVCRMRWRAAGTRPREVALEEVPEPVTDEHEAPNLDEVLTALAALSFNQRAALVMRELEGRSYQEIAEVLGLSTSAVEALLFRARRRLQLDRKSLGAITSVPLPGSLSSFLGGGGGAVATGGAAVAGHVVLKAAALVVAGAVTAGAGYKGVDIVTRSLSASKPQQYTQAAVGPRRHVDKRVTVAVGTERTRGGAVPGAGATSPAAGGVASSATSAAGQLTGTAGSLLTTPPAAAAQLPGAPPSLPQATVSTPTATVPQLPVTLPTTTVPGVTVTTPTVPQLPVSTPTTTVPQLPPPPPLPVSVPTVTTPQLPPPPPLPPIPPK